MHVHQVPGACGGLRSTLEPLEQESQMAVSLTLMSWEPNPSKEQKMLLTTAPSAQSHALVFHDSSINRASRTKTSIAEQRHSIRNTNFKKEAF